MCLTGMNTSAWPPRKKFSVSLLRDTRSRNMRDKLAGLHALSVENILAMKASTGQG